MLQYTCVKLKELRLEQGYTQKHLASLMKISVTRLSKLENLTLMANIYEMASLTYHLNAKLNYITGESSIRKYPIGLPYGQYEQYEKEHNTIKHKKNKV